MRAAIALFLLAGLMPVRFATAEYEDYRCPLETAQAEVRTAIPGGWEKPHYSQPLKNTRVQRRRELVCDYGEAGQIVRRVRGVRTRCSAEINGFVCATRGERLPRVSGEAEVGSGFDLDTGQVTSVGSDIKFENLGPTERYLTLTNQAQIGFAFQRDPDCHHCVHPNLDYYPRHPSDNHRVSIRYFREGTTVCIHTNENRYSIVRVLEDVGLNAQSLLIEYRTCENFSFQ